MINRLLGWLFTLATLAIIAFAVLNRGNYRSMIFNFETQADNEAASTEVTATDSNISEQTTTLEEEAQPIEEESPADTLIMVAE